MKERSYLFDNLKAVLIFCVVFAHFLRIAGHFELGSPSRVIYIICFTFMMEGFFFVSGFFSHNVDKCRAKAVETLIMPYVVFMLLTMGERYLLFGSAHLHLQLPTHAMWFLLVMFYYRFGIKTMEKIPFILPLSAILFLTAGAMPFLGPFMALGRGCSFLVFFMLGFYSKWEYFEKIRRIPKPVMILPAALLVGVSVWFAGQRHFGVGVLLFKECDKVLGVGFVEGIVARFLVAIAALLWLLIWINVLPDKKLPSKGGLITQIGQNTMTVFLLHVFVRQILKWGAHVHHFALFEYDGYIYVGIMLVIALVCIYLFSRPVVAKAYDKSMYFLYLPFGKAFEYLRKVVK